MRLQEIDTGIFRGSRPSDKVDWALLEEYNIRTILDLQYGWYELFTGQMNLTMITALEYGITPVNIRLSDFTAPEAGEITACLKVLRDERYKPVFFHCLHGMDRTGFIAACYRIEVQKWTVDKAIDEIIAEGFHTVPYTHWLDVLRDYYQDKGG